MRHFSITFVVFALLTFGVAMWSLARSFPAQDSETLPPEEISFRNRAGIIFDLVILPAKGLGPLSIYIGSAIWALPLAGITTALMQKKKNENGA